MNELDKEWYEIAREINSIKDNIKNSAKNIINSLNDPKKNIDIDSEFLEVMNGLGKIGTITNNADRVNNYSKALSDAFTHARTDSREISKSIIIYWMNQVSSTSFTIMKKGNRFEISLPKIDFNFMKFG